MRRVNALSDDERAVLLSVGVLGEGVGVDCVICE